MVVLELLIFLVLNQFICVFFSSSCFKNLKRFMVNSDYFDLAPSIIFGS